MSKPTHTPEPWNSVFNPWKAAFDPQLDVFVRDKNGLILAKMRELDGVDHQANASRIVECVNAMEGIENPVEFMNQAIDLLKLCKARFEVKESVLKSPTIITRIDDVLKKNKVIN